MKNIFFIGLRGSGKTTTGQALAKKLNLPFWDTDQLVEEKFSTSIADIVSRHGWEGFRSRESDILRMVCSRQGQVIATGGGTVLAQANRNLISGVVFYLQAPLSVLFARLSQSPASSRRPALYNKNLQEELVISFTEREPLYLSLADHILDATNPVSTLLHSIVRLCPNIPDFQKKTPFEANTNHSF